MPDYQEFISDKLAHSVSRGVDQDLVDEHALMPHQAAITRWAARRGRAAIFADTGLGKTRMQLVWAAAVQQATGLDCLILAPLAVADQTAHEGERINIQVRHVRDQADVQPGISITNYDRLHRFDTRRFGAVVLDESSIIKHHDAKTLGQLMEAFAHTEFRLCATATPAPNDWTELGTHAEFLGICSRSEMLSEYFMHDGGETQTWRLKGHAREPFWRWVSTWGALIRSPADLGFDASAYNLPPLLVEQITVASDAVAPEGQLFALEAQTLSDRRTARRNSLRYRVEACADLANSVLEPWVIWCELNAEADALRAAIPDAVEIRGNDTIDHKEKSLADFAAGKIRVLVTKPKIAGWGLNWQHCRRVGFVGVSDSFEAYYQAVRRCWRFGQTKPVHVYLFVSDQEGAVRANLARKEQAATTMFEALSRETSAAVRDEIIGQQRVSNVYQPRQTITLPTFLRSIS